MYLTELKNEQMKEIVFLRHAKSSWDYSLADRDRPLQPKGIKAIKAVAQHWKSKFQSFDAIVIVQPIGRSHCHTFAHEIGFPFSVFISKKPCIVLVHAMLFIKYIS